MTTPMPMKQFRLSTLLVLGFYLGTPFAAHAETCTQKVDSKRVMIFVDLNANIEEVHAAQRAACARGEKISVIPTDFEQRYKNNLEVARLQKKESVACGYGSQDQAKRDSEACLTAHKNTNLAQNKLYRDAVNVGGLLKVELEKIKSAGGVLPVFAISGHDGGGHFFGLNGSTELAQIKTIFSQFPELQKSVQTVGLLGCYTAVPTQVLKWKGVFPETKLLVGYEGAAPLGDKPAGQTYLEDILRQEKQITGAANAKIMESNLLGSVRGIQIVNSAVYMQSNQCNPDGTKKEYYFQNTPKDGKKFAPFNITACDKAMGELEGKTELYEKYADGEIEIPTETSSGPLREVYSFFRQNEECFHANHRYAPPSDEVFYVLFFNGVKKNFARAFADEIKSDGDAISKMTSESVEVGLRSQLEAMKKQLAVDEADFATYTADPEKYKKKLESDLKIANEQRAILAKDPVIQGYPQMADQNLSEADQKKIREFGQATSLHFQLSGKLQMMDLGRFTNQTTQNLEQGRKFIAEGDLRVSYALREFEAAKKMFWVPTLETIKGKSRKQILENIHALNLISSFSSGLPAGEKVVDLRNRMTAFLQYFRGVPFEWHEESEHPIKPELPSMGLPGTMMDATPTGLGGGMGMGAGVGINPYGGGYGNPPPAGGMGMGMGMGAMPAGQHPLQIPTNPEGN